MRMKRDQFPYPLLAEAFAVFQARLFCKYLVYKEIILEGDALKVFQGLNSSLEVDSYLGMLKSNTRSTIASFDSWSVKHTKHTNNTVAQALGKNALGIRDTIIVLREIPSWIHSLL